MFDNNRDLDIKLASFSNAPRFAFLSEGLRLGGATTFLLNLGSELLRLGCHVGIWTMEQDSPLEKDFEERNLNVSWIGRKVGIFEDRVRECLRELNHFRPSTIVATLGPQSFEVLRYTHGSVAKIGVIQSDDPLVYRELKPYFQLTDFIVGVSKEICRRLREDCGIAAEKIRMIHYGIELPQHEEKPPRDPAHLRVLYLGRLDQVQKRVRLLEPISKRLRELDTNFHLTIVGDGAEREWLAAMIRKNDLSDWVELRSALPYREISGLFDRFDVLLLPSAFEGLPLSLLESMARGIVPVITKLPSGSEEIVHATNGILVEAENTNGYADEIHRLSQDRNLLEAFSEEARRTITEHFSSRTMAQEWLLLDGTSENTNFEVSGLQVLPPYGCESSLRFTTFGRLLRRVKALGKKGARSELVSRLC